MAVLGGRNVISGWAESGCSTWSCDNLDVGRGANTPSSFLSTAAAATSFVPSSHERYYLPPQIPRPVTLPFQVRSTSEAVPSRPTSEIPPTETAFVEIDETDSIEMKQVETGSNLENSKSSENTERDPSQITVEDAERHIQDRPKENLEAFSLRNKEIHVPLSNRIHIVGFGIQGRFFAHALASKSHVPVNMIAHHPEVIRAWGMENRELNLYNDRGRYVSSAGVPCPEAIVGPSYRYPQYPRASDFLDNVIIDTTTGAISRCLQSLRHRIDRQTTICLLHPGLGLVEKINADLFPDPLDRPNFIIAHSTYKEKRQGTLYLHGVQKYENPLLANSIVGYEAVQQSRHLIKLLSSTENLNVVGLPDARFLMWKLPWLIFSAVANSICIIIGCKYNQIYPNPDAWTLWENLLEESAAIVSQFPELQVIPHRAQYFTQPAFRQKMTNYLIAQGTNACPWVRQSRLGIELPIDYFNGYLVRRAKELRLDHKYNSMAMSMMKGRINSRRWELKVDLLGTTQYMKDSDTIPNLDDLDPDLDIE
ncbi:hypothetical protein F4824DRAFT_489605 [Ustulina deusta]|nr:hypothetical protein F4824DRAFT_489605 [Ustulina deusta]